MKSEAIHQLLHGYKGGHGRIGGSIKLEDKDSETITRLSDLSGSLSSGLQAETYLTAYPLPSRRFFAVARTWPDPEAPRKGCVLTHSILVPLEAWGTMRDVRLLKGLFCNPRTSPNNDYGEALREPASNTSSPPADDLRIDDAAAHAYVSRYFGQGVRPIVWFNAVDPEEHLWRLLEHLWPTLRRNFSSCTFALQQRTLEDRPFDLLFAPSQVQSRFLKLSPKHIIDAVSARKEAANAEPWCSHWAGVLFSPEGRKAFRQSELAIWHELGEDPSALKKLSLIEDLRERAPQSPTAGVGAMDVVESLAHEPDAALPLKRLILADAIAAAASEDTPGNGLMSLRLIDERLRREAFSTVSEEFSDKLEGAAARVTVLHPEEAVEARSDWLADSIADLQGAFVKGVMLGFRELAQSSPRRLEILQDHPEIAAEIFRFDPSFAATFLEVGGPSAPQTLAEWLSLTDDKRTLRIVRKSVLRVLTPESARQLLGPLLRNVHSDEVPEILSVASVLSNHFTDTSIRHIVADQVGFGFSEAVRQWASQLEQWSEGISALAATTFSRGKQGLQELIDDRLFSRHQRAEILAFLLLNRDRGASYWLREIFSQDARFIEVLLVSGKDRSEGIDAALSLLLEDVRDLPFDRVNELFHTVLSFEGCNVFPKLFDAALRSTIRRYLIEGTEDAYRQFLNSQHTSLWFEGVPGPTISRLLVDACHEGAASVGRAWRWVAEAPGALYGKNPSILPELCDELIRYSRYSFPNGAEPSLVQMLIRAKQEARPEVRSALSTKMLRFAFDNVKCPVGGVVSEAFQDVYVAALQEDNRQASIFSTLFKSYSWDRAKDLRISIIDAFLRSAWRPGDLAVAAHNAGILRKMVKRLLRYPRGSDYMKAMLHDLPQRQDAVALRAFDQLQSLAAEPNFDEEWD